ncbi:MAG: xylulokinase [Candidatus Geothermincolia bacterium]
MNDRYIISHDVGTGGSKAVLTDIAGKIIAREFEPYETSYPAHECAEQFADDWWAAIASTTRRLMAASGLDPRQVIGMGFATQMLGILPVDENGKPLCPAIIWLDCRAEKQAQRMVRRLGGARVVRAVAGAVPTGKDVVCKLKWLKENEAELWRDAHLFLDVNGYLIHRSTGKFVIDESGASATGLLDLKSREWSGLFARILGIPLAKLPPVKNSVEIAGELTAAAAAELGLAEGTPVICGMGDVPAAATGSGALEHGDGHIYIGTSGWLCISVEKPCSAGKYGIAPLASSDPNMWLAIGETETAGACLKWFAQQLARRDEMERARGDFGIFEILDEVVREVPASAHRVIFTPWMYGERSPVCDTAVRSAFINVSVDSTREDILRSVYEGVALNCRWLLEAVGGIGFPLPTVRAIGGGARSDIWMQIFADVTGRRIEAVEDAQEAGAIGTALAVAAALGVYPDYKELKNVVRVRRTFEPSERSGALYDELFSSFKYLYERLAPAYKALNQGD